MSTPPPTTTTPSQDNNKTPTNTNTNPPTHHHNHQDGSQLQNLEEDDLGGMEDDWKNQATSMINNIHDHDGKNTPESTKEHPQVMVKEAKEAISGSPSRRSTSRSPPARRGIARSPTSSGSSMVKTSDNARADSCSILGDNSQVVEDNAFARKLTGHITVNGVKLTDLQKLKNKQHITKKTTTSKKKGQQKPGKQQQQQGTTTPSGGMRGQLLRYLVEKKANGILSTATGLME